MVKQERKRKYQHLYSRKWAGGSYTVEAAFIVPIILGLSFTILYMLFVFHDKAVLQANLNNILFLLAEEQISCGEEDYMKHLGQSTWFVELSSIDISENAVSYSGKVAAKANIELPVLSFFINENQKFTLSESYSKMQPEQIKRLGGNED